jgi:hypothetical protein
MATSTYGLPRRVRGIYGILCMFVVTRTVSVPILISPSIVTGIGCSNGVVIDDPINRGRGRIGYIVGMYYSLIGIGNDKGRLGYVTDETIKQDIWEDIRLTDVKICWLQPKLLPGWYACWVWSIDVDPY